MGKNRALLRQFDEYRVGKTYIMRVIRSHDASGTISHYMNSDLRSMRQQAVSKILGLNPRDDISSQDPTTPKVSCLSGEGYSRVQLVARKDQTAMYFCMKRQSTLPDTPTHLHAEVFWNPALMTHLMPAAELSKHANYVSRSVQTNVHSFFLYWSG